jgi:hypothetical protein
MAFYRHLLVVFAISVIPILALGQGANHVIPLLSSCVTGEPFSASRTLDYEPTAGASDLVGVHREATVYRDSEGRIRTDLKYPGYAAVFLQDCVTQLIYNWRVGDTELRCGTMEHSGMGTVTDKTVPSLRPNEDVVLVEGVETRHSRSVRRKDGKVELIYEHWYAPSLHLDLLQAVYGGDLGKTTDRILNLKTEEPDAALFQIPEGFTTKTRNCPATPASLPRIDSSSSARQR